MGRQFTGISHGFGRHGGEKTPPLLHLTNLRFYFYPENAKRYANIAISRYCWAVQHLDTRGQIASLFYNTTTVPIYVAQLVFTRVIVLTLVFCPATPLHVEIHEKIDRTGIIPVAL